jgi:3-dehydroquinate synthetase
LAQGLISANDAERIFALIDRYGFDTTLPIEHKQLLDAIKADKKRSGSTLHLILPTAVGAVEDRLVSFEELNTIL